MSSEARRKMAAAKGKLTQVLSRVTIQESIHPSKRNPSGVRHIQQLLKQAEESHTAAFESITKPSADDLESRDNFIQDESDTRDRLDALFQQVEAYSVLGILTEELEDWEETSKDESSTTLLEGITRLEELYTQFRSAACTHGTSDSTELRRKSKDIRRRISALKSSIPPSSPPSTASEVTSDEPALRQGIKARTIPLPTFSGELSDWRSFWRRFCEYIGKIKGITNDEKLSFLLESLKDPAAKQIVTDSIRNGDTFDDVSTRLETKFDQPREVFLEALKGLLSMTSLDYNRSSLSTLSRDLTRFANILTRYGDGSAEQMYTAIVESNMSPRLLEEWRLHNKAKDEIPKSDELIKFCDERELVLQGKEKLYDKSSVSKPPTRSGHSASSSKPYRPPKFSKPSSSLHVSVSQCKVCNADNHPLYFCQTFKDMDVDLRKQVIRNSHCHNCLRSNHTTRQCKSQSTCRDCGGRHHTLLHKPESQQSPQASSQQSPRTSSQQSSQASSQQSPTSQHQSHIPQMPAQGTVLTSHVPDKTALVWSCQVLLEAGDKVVITRAMIDSGSTLSFMTFKVANALHAHRVPFPTTVSGLEQAQVTTCRYKVNVTLKSVHNSSEPPLQLSAALVESITGSTPATELTQNSDLSFTANFRLADPNFGSPGAIELLLGQDVLPVILRSGFIQSPSSSLYALNTMFGWVLGGYCTTPSEAVIAHICWKTNSSDSTTNEFIQAFWESEEPPSDRKILSTEDLQAMKSFEETVSREPDGRYQVRLPQRATDAHLGHSKKQAVRRYYSNKRSLERQGRWTDFANAVSEYAELGHSELVPQSDMSKSDSDVFYLPMHGVIKESSTSTKLRVVFDASAKSSTGYSLNDMLLSGPTLYPLLTSTLIRFRQHRIGMSADISKMFREVSLHPEDRDLHRYVAEDSQHHLQDHRMTRVTFGVTSSPFLATQVLRKLADDYVQTFPEAAAVITSSFYVDDCLTGANSLQEAVHLRETLNLLLNKAKMTLRKWRSNCSELMELVPPNLRERETIQLIQAPTACHKTLGVHWDTSQDTLHVATPELNNDSQPSKRHVLSDIARTFDVLGWFTPVTIILKIVLQKLWTLELGWDELLPADLAEVWLSWRAELKLITNQPVQRSYYRKDKTVPVLNYSSPTSLPELKSCAVTLRADTLTLEPSLAGSQDTLF